MFQLFHQGNFLLWKFWSIYRKIIRCTFKCLYFSDCFIKVFSSCASFIHVVWKKFTYKFYEDLIMLVCLMGLYYNHLSLNASFSVNDSASTCWIDLQIHFMVTGVFAPIMCSHWGPSPWVVSRRFKLRLWSVHGIRLNGWFCAGV